MFPSFLPNSYFARLMTRLDGMDAAAGALGGRIDGVETVAAANGGRLDDAEIWMTEAGGRLDDAEQWMGTAGETLDDLAGIADGHNTRLAALELWRGSKSSHVEKINATGMAGLNVLGITVLSAANTRTIADKVDRLIDVLREREIIEAAP